MNDFRFSLAKYHGKSTLLECPNCHQRQLVPYVDNETGEILDPTCGRCNRESKCAYHLTPSQYFQQNPGARPQGDAWRQAPDWLKKSRFKPKSSTHLLPEEKAPERIWDYPRDLMEKTQRPDRPCDFLTYIRTLFPEETVLHLARLYRLGVTKAKEVIFPQIDIQGRYRGAKVMGYDPVRGKRVKHTDHDVDWLHPRLQKAGILPKDWKMSQVLFGEHLIKEFPDRLIILVESEKTAVIGTGYCPQYNWLATGGKTQLGDKLNILQGHKVLVIPDVDAFEYWTKYFSERPYLGVRISRMIENEATPEEREEQIDIADWLIRAYGSRKPASVSSVSAVSVRNEEKHPETQYANPVAQEVSKYFPPEVMPELAALIDDLDLQIVSITHVKPNQDEEDTSR